ncbi:MAG: VOC family protein [Acaryochloridaceae cyanobacterium CSU_3_4]|nr:VOC family protein [Acaryochloridaceae cyanobacterium CSU_3_4]
MIQEEFYPMPLFVRVLVGDVAVAAQWYAEALGFRSVYTLPAADGTQLMNHIRLERYQDLILMSQPSDSLMLHDHGLVINFSYSGNLQALAERASATGVTVTGPIPTTYNTYEVTIIDPHGYPLIFSQILNRDRSFAEVMPAC